MIEILQDGKPFWEDLPGAKDHFRFGLKKATLILTCLDAIMDFYTSDGCKPEAPIVISSKKWQTRCSVRRHEGFERDGKWYDKPYLELENPDEQDTRVRPLKFGYLKATAIVYLTHSIKEFVTKRRITSRCY